MAFLAPRPVQNGRHWQLLVRRVNIEDSKMLLLHGNGLSMTTQRMINQRLGLLRHMNSNYRTYLYNLTVWIYFVFPLLYKINLSSFYIPLNQINHSLFTLISPRSLPFPHFPCSISTPTTPSYSLEVFRNCSPRKTTCSASPAPKYAHTHSQKTIFPKCPQYSHSFR
jgi:hypothetical protein